MMIVNFFDWIVLVFTGMTAFPVSVAIHSYISLTVTSFRPSLISPSGADRRSVRKTLPSRVAGGMTARSVTSETAVGVSASSASSTRIVSTTAGASAG